jgi:thiol:disulfide interchange protein DsbC
MRLKFFLLPLLLAAAAAWGAPATGDDIPPDIATRIRATLHERIPELQVKGLHQSPIPGLFELDAGGELLYINDTGSLIFAGRIVDTKTREDLSAARWNEINAIDFNALPFDLAIKTVRGDGSRKLAVFADPLCPYCRQLEQEMQGVTNITIYTFLFPLETIHPGASVKAVNIWCAKDRSATWSKWMLQKTEPDNTRCAGAPLDKLQTLGQKLNVDSTPTMFTADGKRTRGAIKHNEIESLLASAGAHK